MRVYIAGPMTGYEDFNFPAFMHAEEAVQGFWPDAYIINPARLDSELGFPYTPEEEGTPVAHQKCMQRDLPHVATSHKIVLLEGWTMSLGATYEVVVAMACGLEFYEWYPGLGILAVSREHILYSLNRGPHSIVKVPA